MTKKTGKTKTHFKTNEKIINKQKAAEHAWMQGDGVGNTLIQIVLQKNKGGRARLDARRWSGQHIDTNSTTKKKKAAEHAWMQGDGVGTTTLGKNAEKSCSRV
jgi:hypothetical protein